MSAGTRNIFLCLLVLLSACATSKQTISAGAAINHIKLLGEYDIPYNLQYAQTTIGGLSGIDYDPASRLYYMISDDRSDNNPARFYTARIVFTEKGIDSVVFTGALPMRQPGGNVYPSKKTDRAHTPDPEAMRYDPTRDELTWSSEGERIVKAKDTVLEDPAITVIGRDGNFKRSIQIPPNLVMHSTEKGPRQNGVFEGLTFADHFNTLFVSVEEPLYEDGPRADLTDNKPFIRILKFNVANGYNLAQYAYKLEPVAYPENPTGSFKINGIPDIMSLGNNKLLVIERSYSSGRLACTIKLFIADLSGATDVKDMTLKDNIHFTAITKKLLLNMDDLGIYIDNIEGVTFGPTLPDGHRTLLFIADNNFAAEQKAQVLLFEVE